MDKIFKISGETVARNYVYSIKVNKNDKKISFIDKKGRYKKILSAKKIYDLVDKKNKDRFKTNNAIVQQIRKYKRCGSKLIDSEKFYVYS